VNKLVFRRIGGNKVFGHEKEKKEVEKKREA